MWKWNQPPPIVLSSGERDVRESIRRTMHRVIERVPESAMPFLISKQMVRENIDNMLDQLSAEVLLEMAVMSFADFDKLFDNVAKDWIREAVGQKKSEYTTVRAALAKAAMIYPR